MTASRWPQFADMVGAVSPASAPSHMRTTSGTSMSRYTDRHSRHTRVRSASRSSISQPGLPDALTEYPAGGVFKLELFLPDDYPMTPPKIRFLTKIFHPNVDKLGRICLDVLKSEPPALRFAPHLHRDADRGHYR